jgi:hypothetical protein
LGTNAARYVRADQAGEVGGSQPRISRQGYSYDEIKAIAQELHDNYPKYRN